MPKAETSIPTPLPHLGFPGSAGEEDGGGQLWGCRAITLPQSLPCRADSLAHQSSGQKSIRPSQARYPQPAARSAAVLQRRGGGFTPRSAPAGILSQNKSPRSPGEASDVAHASP